MKRWSYALLGALAALLVVAGGVLGAGAFAGPRQDIPLPEGVVHDPGPTDPTVAPTRGPVDPAPSPADPSGEVPGTEVEPAPPVDVRSEEEDHSGPGGGDADGGDGDDGDRDGDDGDDGDRDGDDGDDGADDGDDR